LLDRPGGRWVLGKAASVYARRFYRADVEVMRIRGLWTRRVEANFFPDGPSFESVSLGSWKTQRQEYLRDTHDYWLKHYRPKKGDVIIDIGAGRGEDSFTFSQEVGDAGRVIAIEASPRSFAILNTFCHLNRLNNVTALNVALMDNPGIVRIIEDESSWTKDSVLSGGEPGGVEVRAVTLDNIYQESGLKHIAFIKMNIEGAERYALLGMEAVLRLTRHICVACHDFRSENGDGEQYRTRAFVECFLTNHGFSVTSNPDDPRDSVRDHLFGTRCS
jgi:FkbM family methyltransferase